MRRFSLLSLFLFVGLVCCCTPHPAITKPSADMISVPVAFIPPTHVKSAKRKGVGPKAKAFPGSATHTVHHGHAITIIIDPGHGGEDQGAKSLGKPTYSEKNFNLVAARFLKQDLEQMGYYTVMTREKDIFVTLDRRARSGTHPTKEIFVSVHFNAAQSPEAEGIEVFYYDAKDNKQRTDNSKALAQAVFKYIISATDAKARGVKHGNYHVIRESVVPAILIEGGFLTHPGELEKIKDPAYLKKLSWGIAQGLDHYLEANTR